MRSCEQRRSGERHRRGTSATTGGLSRRDVISRVISSVIGGVVIGADGLKGFKELKAAGVTHVARAQPRQGDLRQGEPLHHAAPSPTADGPRHLQTRRAVESPAK